MDYGRRDQVRVHSKAIPPPPVPEQIAGAQLRVEWVMRTTSVSTTRQVLAGEDHSNSDMYPPTKKVRNTK